MRLMLMLLALSVPAAYANAARDAAAPDTATAAPNSHDDMVVVALSLIGTPYKFGGTSPETGFDCSGLVQYVLGLSSPVTLPRRAEDMYRSSGHAIAVGDLKAGDLVFFRIGQSKAINHVAVYIGEKRFVHAPSRGGFVRVDEMGGDYWQRYFVGARRVLPENDLLAASGR